MKQEGIVCNMRVCMVEDGAKDKLVELDLLQKIFLYSVKRMVIFVNTRIDHSTLKADGCVTWELGHSGICRFWKHHEAGAMNPLLFLFFPSLAFFDP